MGLKQSDLALAEEDVGAELQAASPEAKRRRLISFCSDYIIMVYAGRRGAEEARDHYRVQATAVRSCATSC